MIVFLASACGLIIEIVAGRLLAPRVGVSLYSWTTVIGVVLAGISVGNYLGGRVADRFPSPTTLGLILLAGAVSSLSVLPLVGVVSYVFDGLSVLPRIVCMTTSLFFLPSLIVGMVTPVVIKLRLRDLARTGNVVGTVYAISTAGGIFGTFITGFVLIQWMGTRQIVLLVALVLALLAMAFGRLWRAKAPAFVSMVLLALLGAFSAYSGALASECTRESNYYCIRVSDAMVDGHKVKILGLDYLLHSYNSLEDPKLLVYGYEKILSDITSYIAQGDPEFRVLFIGGGGYTMPRYLEAVYPDSTLEVIEIDPEVTRVAFEHLGLRPDTSILTYNEDARMVVQKLPAGWYDLVVGDAFHDVAVPYQLTTREFDEQVRALLNDRGFYFSNVVDRLHSGRFLRAYVNTLQQVFPYVRIVSDEARWDSDEQKPYVVVASVRPLSREVLAPATLQSSGNPPVSHFMPEEVFNSWLRSQGSILLTDDYAPVENLMASTFLQSDNKRRAQRHYAAGMALESQGRSSAAVEEYNEAIQLTPELVPAYYARGAVYTSLGQFRRAIEDFNQAIRLDPQNIAAYQMRGTAYVGLGQPRRGVEDLDVALRLDPRAGQTYAQRALLSASLEEDARAWDDFSEAVRLGVEPTALRGQLEQLTKPRLGNQN